LLFVVKKDELPIFDIQFLGNPSYKNIPELSPALSGLQYNTGDGPLTMDHKKVSCHQTIINGQPTNNTQPATYNLQLTIPCF